MNNNEFDRWIDFHCDCFSDFGDSLRKSLGNVDVLATWRDALKYVSLPDAKEATRRMIADEDLQPSGWSKHPSAIRKIVDDIRNQRHASQPKRKFINGEEVYDCGFCKDTGIVTILAPRFVEAVRRGLLKREPFDVPRTSTMAKKDNWRWGEYRPRGGAVRAGTFAVACCCELGRPVNFRNAQFDADRHYQGDVPITDAENRDFDAFVNSLGELRPSNYVGAFDAFNEGR
jgi:hypothetical protein